MAASVHNSRALDAAAGTTCPTRLHYLLLGTLQGKFAEMKVDIC